MKSISTIKATVIINANSIKGGERVHRPITITKEVDKSTPLLNDALTNNGF